MTKAIALECYELDVDEAHKEYVEAEAWARALLASRLAEAER